MKTVIRSAVPLIVLLAIVASIMLPMTDRHLNRWLEHDVEQRSQLVFDAARVPLQDLMRQGQTGRIAAIFNDIARNRGILAVAWCGAERQPVVASMDWPGDVACSLSANDDRPGFAALPTHGSSLMRAVFPISVGGRGPNAVVILHDLSFIDRRRNEARLWLGLFLAAITVFAAAATALVARLTLRGWMRTVVATVRQHQVEGYQAGVADEMEPVVREIRRLIWEIDAAPVDAAIHVEWSPETLRRVLEKELPDADIMLVSNREPYIHEYDDEKITVHRPASGLVTALEPVIRACRGTWIAHGTGSADRAVTDERGRVMVPPEDPSYTLRRIWLTEEEEQGYYYGFANEGLWPLCHISFVRPQFRETDWAAYVTVNQKFADAVVGEATTDNPIILVQDYHLALLPRLVRQRLPKATIITFWHIPWPNSEIFSICPWRDSIIDGLLGSSIIGFHTQFHCNNFIEAVDRFSESHIERDRSRITKRGHSTLIRPYPISVEWPPEAAKHVAPVDTCREAVRRRFDLRPDTMLGVGVERLDFTKGIADRFHAVGRFLEKHPEWVGRFVFLQVAAPSRGRLPAYRLVQEETVAAAEEVNARFGNDGYKPILLVMRHHDPNQVYEIYRAADLCVVSSLHDGMNLVAKEFVASREDERGVLILSTFAGASRELPEALTVNPYDTEAMADAIHDAVRMPPDRQAQRMALMRASVKENNVYFWAGRMLLDAARLRRRSHIEGDIAKLHRKRGGDRQALFNLQGPTAGN